MVKIYARLIQKQVINKNTGKPWTLDDMPENLREEVQRILDGE